VSEEEPRSRDPYRELSLKMLVDKAIGGDLDAAELALKILARAER
jgi:hypothetical protein